MLAFDSGASNHDGVEDDAPGGEREWRFCGGSLVVRTYEDFLNAAIGGIVTTASADLARFAAEVAPEQYWRGRSCVELGSGCGLVSSVLLRLGARVLATELDPFLSHLRWNLQLNAPDSVEESCVAAFDWGDVEAQQATLRRLGTGGADAIFAANCVYDKDAVPILFSAVRSISGPSTETFVCGVPVPRSAAASSSSSLPTVSSAAASVGGAAMQGTILDAFLGAAVQEFDCYLLRGADASHGPEATDMRQQAVLCPEPNNDNPTELGVAAVIASQHGVSVGQLADGIWLFLAPGRCLPPWVRPQFCLKAELGPGAGTPEC